MINRGEKPDWESLQVFGNGKPYGSREVSAARRFAAVWLALTLNPGISTKHEDRRRLIRGPIAAEFDSFASDLRLVIV
jgi:hypothetical protein